MSEFYLLILISVLAIAGVIYKFCTGFWRSEKDKKRRQARPILTVLFLFFGLWMLWDFSQQRNLARESVNWPVANGRILYSYTCNSGHECEAERYGYAAGRHGSLVKYSYSVNHQPHTSWMLAFNVTRDQQYGDLEAKYPKGASVAVRYSPSNPSFSCLEIGNTNLLGTGFYVPLAILVIAALFM